MKLLGNLKHGLLFVISAPAGTGKTTLTSRLYDEYKGLVVPSISCTTREKRAGEIDGVHYHFLSKAEFQEKIATGAFLEYKEIFGSFYGTLKNATQKAQEKGEHVVMVIDTEGAMAIQQKLKATLIFVAPPSLEVLEARLRKRGTESRASIEERLARATLELSFAKKYDYIVINDELEIAYQAIKSIIVAEEHRSDYQYGLLNQ